MIISRKLLFLHLPKTGGIFVSELLQELEEAYGRYRQQLPWWKKGFYAPPLFENFRHNPQIPYERMQIHNFRSHIPPQHQKKQLFSVIRNPFDLYVSLYEFRTWQFDTGLDSDFLEKQFPDYPDLSFSRFLDYCDQFLLDRYLVRQLAGKTNTFPGFFSTLALLMYFSDPWAALKVWETNPESINQPPPDVHFLKFEHLRQELVAFLQPYYPAQLLRVIDQKPVANFGTSRNARPWPDYYDPGLRKRILNREQLLFSWFPEYHSL